MKKEVVEKVSNLLIAAFGLVAALAWNGAIQAIFQKYYANGTGIGAQLFYAIIVTVIAVLFAIWIGKLSEKASVSKK